MYAIDDPAFIAIIEKSIPISRLELRLRPAKFKEDTKLSNDEWFRLHDEDIKDHDNFQDFSSCGFIGEDESLLEVVRSDWEVVEKYGTTHKEIGERLSQMINIAEKEMSDIMKGWRSLPYKLLPKKIGRKLGIRYEVDESRNVTKKLMNGYVYQIASVRSLGVQTCPWGCQAAGDNAGFILPKGLSNDVKQAIIIKTGGHQDLLDKVSQRFNEATNIQNDFKRLKEELRRLDGRIMYAPLTHLLPHLIEEHFFFEGRKSGYRANPELLIKALGIANC